MKTPMSLVIAVALALYSGSLGAKASVSVVWPLAVLLTGAVEFRSELWWFYMCLCIELVLATVYGTVFLQCLHIVRILSDTQLQFIMLRHTIYIIYQYTQVMFSYLMYYFI